MSMILDSLKNKEVHVVGVMGAEGSSVSELFMKHGISFVAHELSNEEQLEERFFSCHDWMSAEAKLQAFKSLLCGAKDLRCGSDYLKGVESADVVVVPQSYKRLKENEPLFNLDKGKLLSMTELYLRLAPGRVIGVTGTNGKSTSSAMISHILKESHGDKVMHCGNDRKNDQSLANLRDKDPEARLVLEISNRQLMQLDNLSPHSAVVTNISPNHLDDHGTFSDYIEAKQRIVKWQKKGDFAVLNYDDPFVRDFAKGAKASVAFYSTEEVLPRGAFLKDDALYLADLGCRPEKIISCNEMKVRGKHNYSNALAAILAAREEGVSSSEIRTALASFSGLGSRMEKFAEKNGRIFIEDSAGCNPVNLKVAVESMKESYFLITGGYRTHPAPGEFDRPCKAILDNPPKALALIGDTAELIQETIKEQGKFSFPVHICKDLKEAFDYVLSKSSEGDTILFAPGSESFGMFKDYRDRAQKFRELVEKY